MTPAGSIRLTAPAQVVYGRPCAEVLAEEAARRDVRRVFVLSTRSLAQGTDEVERIESTLGPRFAASFDAVPAHAPTDAIVEAAALARDARADLLVAVGGSSVTDAGKVLRICLKHGLTAPDQLESYRFTLDAQGRPVVPEFAAPDIGYVVVPTTLSGSEFTPMAGAKNRSRNIKEGYRHPALAPQTVVFDPAITVHTPAWLWLSSGVRALDHALETVGSLRSNDFCDAIAESALRLLTEGLAQVKREPADLEARLKCQFGLWLSMVPGGTGVPMGVSHAIGHVLGGLLGVPHGYTSCVMAPAALRFNQPSNAAKQRRISAALGQPERQAADLVGAFIRELGLPATLGEVGVDRSRFAAIAEKCMHEPWIYTNPRPIAGPQQIVEILEMAA
ncbi:MAG: Maleylacetate reductase [Burkholderiaceae bacterium]|nr:Maleylacetate reductase [Burkholderiaceae bacterium]